VMSAGSGPKGSFAWRRKFRIAEQYHFERARRQGRCISYKYFLLCYVPNSLPYPRFGFVLSKRLGKATVRNKARRWLRESVRGLLPRISGGWDIVFIARKPIIGAGFNAVAEAVREALDRNALIGADRVASATADSTDKGIPDSGIAPVSGCL
jgi:ribonuclease P protein component